MLIHLLHCVRVIVPKAVENKAGPWDQKYTKHCFLYAFRQKIKINFPRQLRPKHFFQMSETQTHTHSGALPELQVKARKRRGSHSVKNACGRLNTLQNMAISTRHSQRAGGPGWLHPADHKTTTPADDLCSQSAAANTLSLNDGFTSWVIDFNTFMNHFYFKNPLKDFFICLQVILLDILSWRISSERSKVITAVLAVLCAGVGHKYSGGIPSLWPTWLLRSKHFSNGKHFWKVRTYLFWN